MLITNSVYLIGVQSWTLFEIKLKLHLLANSSNFCMIFTEIMFFSFAPLAQHVTLVFSRFVKLRYDLGKGVGEAKSNVTVSLDTWYTVQASRTAKTGNLIVNGSAPVDVTSPGSAVALDVHSNFYLGGVRQLSNVNPNAVDNDASFVQDFTGCIDHFEVCVLHCQ